MSGFGAIWRTRPTASKFVQPAVTRHAGQACPERQRHAARFKAVQHACAIHADHCGNSAVCGAAEPNARGQVSLSACV